MTLGVLLFSYNATAFKANELERVRRSLNSSDPSRIQYHLGRISTAQTSTEKLKLIENLKPYIGDKTYPANHVFRNSFVAHPFAEDHVVLEKLAQLMDAHLDHPISDSVALVLLPFSSYREKAKTKLLHTLSHSKLSPAETMDLAARLILDPRALLDGSAKQTFKETLALNPETFNIWSKLFGSQSSPLKEPAFLRVAQLLMEVKLIPAMKTQKPILQMQLDQLNLVNKVWFEQAIVNFNKANTNKCDLFDGRYGLQRPPELR